MIIKAKGDGRGRVDLYRHNGQEWVWFTDCCAKGFLEAMKYDMSNSGFELILSVTAHDEE
jgi:hypothetical protein